MKASPLTQFLFLLGTGSWALFLATILSLIVPSHPATTGCLALYGCLALMALPAPGRKLARAEAGK